MATASSALWKLWKLGPVCGEIVAASGGPPIHVHGANCKLQSASCKVEENGVPDLAAAMTKMAAVSPIVFDSGFPRLPVQHEDVGSVLFGSR